MRILNISTIAIIAALSAGASFAQPVTPGTAQLAASAGVSAEGFTDAQLIRLLQAQKDNNKEEINFILSQRGAVLSRSDMGGSSVGEAQFALGLGVEPGKYSLNELQRLERAMADNDYETIRFFRSGENRSATGGSTATPGAMQMAAVIGVNASDYSLNELTALYHEWVEAELNS